MLINFQESGCALNKFFISMNLILSVIISAVSILPAVQEKLPRSGLLQSSVVSMYVTYVTWSAVANSPSTFIIGAQRGATKTTSNFIKNYLFVEECNPGFWGLFGGKSSGNFDVIGLIIWMLCVLYSSIRSASKSSKITMSENMLVKDNGAGKVSL